MAQLGVVDWVPRALSGAKLALLLWFIAATNPFVLMRAQAIGVQGGLAVFVVVWLAAVLATSIVAFSPSTTTRVCWSLLLGAASMGAYSFESITATYLTFADFENLLGLTPFAGNAVQMYQPLLMAALGKTVVGLLAINLPPPHDVNLSRLRLVRWAPIVPCLPVLLISWILYARGGEGSNGLPAQYNPLAFATMLSIGMALEGPTPPRSSVDLPRRGEGEVRHLVVLIDESVRGDYLDINSPAGVNTSLDQFASQVVNFGIAAAGANCSAEANVTLRYGATRRTYLRDIATRPSIWAFAKRAEYRTVYIDGQRTEGQLHNLMTDDERRDIDQLMQLSPDLKPYAKDTSIARLIRQLIRRPERHFILVNKSGVHFPFEGKYPESRVGYTPRMRVSYFGNESDPQVPREPAWHDAEPLLARTMFLNSYRNAVQWNVRAFFRTLLTGVDLGNALIIYTSDHGQDFHEDGRPGWATHCSRGSVAAGEGIVPFVAITTHPKLLSQFRKAAATNLNRVSHFNLFPTLLLLMGYSASEMRASPQYERSILDDLTDNQQRFLSDYFVRFGRKPVWNSIWPLPPAIAPARLAGEP